MIDNKRPSYNYFNNTFIVERIYALILRNVIFSTVFDMLHSISERTSVPTGH